MSARGFGAGALLAIGALLLPGAVVAHWATTQLLDAERFVASLAPLADDPAVQDLIIEEVSVLVDEEVDISGVTSDLLTQLGGALDLGPRAEEALELLSEPVAAGVRSLVTDVVGDVVRSPAFSAAWESSLELAHREAIGLLSGSPESLLQADEDGTLSIPLGPVVASVREALVEKGVPFAAAIPDSDRTVEIAQVDSLPAARAVFQVGTGIGAWLPWVTGGILLGALVLSGRRQATLRTAGVVILLVVGLLALGAWIARTALAAYVGPESADVTDSILEATIGQAAPAVIAIATIALLAIVVGWWLGPSPRAGRARASASEILARAGASGPLPQWSTESRLVAWLRGHRRAAVAIAVGIGLLPALLAQSLSVTTVLVGALLALLLIAVIEALRGGSGDERLEEVERSDVREANIPA